MITTCVAARILKTFYAIQSFSMKSLKKKCKMLCKKKGALNNYLDKNVCFLTCRSKQLFFLTKIYFYAQTGIISKLVLL